MHLRARLRAAFAPLCSSRSNQSRLVRTTYDDRSRRTTTHPPTQELILVRRREPRLKDAFQQLATMEPALIRAITDKSYDKRKVAALELERIGEHPSSVEGMPADEGINPPVRDASSANEVNRLNQLVGQLIKLSSSAITTTRSGGIMGLAGIS
jgi:hypothetical protein